MRTYRKVIRIVLLVIVGAVVGITVYRFNAQRLLGNSMPMVFGRGAAVVLSGSMEPTLYKDDLVFVRERESYSVGDIVVYQSRNSLVIHRIIAIDGETVTTQGDNRVTNNVADAPFPISDIKGVMTGKLSGAGKVVNAVRSPAGTVTLLVVAVLLLVLSERKQRVSDESQFDSIREEIEKLKAEALKDGGEQPETEAPEEAKEGSEKGKIE